MLNTLSFAWVKNVYSLGITDGITSGLLYTGVFESTTNPHSPVHKYVVIPTFIPSFYARLSTLFLSLLTDTVVGLYTVSTVPIIKTKKEN